MRRVWLPLLLVALGVHFLRGPASYAGDWEIAPWLGTGSSEIRQWERFPILDEGRVKPFPVFAREKTLEVVGALPEKWSPVELLLSWLSEPKKWETQAFLKVSSQTLRQQWGLEEKRLFFSPREILDRLLQRKGHPVVGEGPRLAQRLAVFQALTEGSSWFLIPQLGGQAWLSLSSPGLEQDPIYQTMLAYVGAYRAKDRLMVYQLGSVLEEQLWKRFQYEQPDVNLSGLQRKLLAEMWMEKIPFLLLAACLALGAGLVSILVAVFGLPWQVGIWILGVASCLLQLIAMGLRVWVAGRPPVTNMYESLLWVSFGVLGMGLLFFWHRTRLGLLGLSSFLSGVGLMIASLASSSPEASLDAGIRPLMPVLRSPVWLMVHVLTITLSYAAFALTFGLSHLALWLAVRRRVSVQQLSLGNWIYRTMQLGVFLIAAGTLLGGVWADYSWGRFWGWDPKEVWALITLLSYLILLHGRYAGWLRPFHFVIGSILSFLSVLMAWYGVNFILGTGLHSYGFSKGGQGWIALFVGLQLCYLLGMGIFYRQRVSYAVSSQS